MGTTFPKPRIFVSKCLGFEKCRWNGEILQDAFVDKLKTFVEYITVCPECEIGLGVPRDPIRIVLEKDTYKLMQLNTGKDVSDSMGRFSSKYLASIDDIDGFILKDRSPSCGLKDVKVYKSLKPSSSVERTSGFFAKEVLKHFPNSAVDTEARLTNLSIREHFLTKAFTLAKFRSLFDNPQMKHIVQYHAENKFLLMAYSQKELSNLGNIVANIDKRKPNEVLEEYGKHLRLALFKPPKFTSTINVIIHAFGYFSKNLSKKEKEFFLNSLEEYRREQVPLSVPIKLLRADIIRFEVGYLSQQTFFEPYPADLAHAKDSGKGRKY